jgi:hypothetical protein
MSFPIPIPTPSVGEIISYVRRPRLVAFIPDGEPSIQSVGQRRRAFFHVGVKNIGGTPVKNARLYLSFKGTQEEVGVLAKWDFKAEPVDSYTTPSKVVPWLIVDSQVHDILPALRETFAAVIKYEGENEAYTFSGFSYLYPDLKQHKLDRGKYTVTAKLASENYRGSFSFEVVNDGPNFSDFAIRPLREYKGDKTFKAIEWL